MAICVFTSRLFLFRVGLRVFTLCFRAASFPTRNATEETAEDLKESNLIELAEYTKANQLIKKSAYSRKKREHIICAVTRRKRKNKKYGVTVLQSVAKAGILSFPIERDVIPQLLPISV